MLNPASPLLGKKIVLGLTGGIACYKAAELARALVKEGADVQVVMTDGATHFITPLTMQTLTGIPVHTSQWDTPPANMIPHIDIVRKADAILIAPCTANVIAKVANGIADDLLTSMCLARLSSTPFLMAPAMNVEMWHKKATQRNVSQLKEDGAIIVGPASGYQACGDVGEGRMLEPNEIVEEVIAAFIPKVLKGKRVLLTAGPTFEPIDPVRGITNRSSGKMGYAIARAAHEAGAEVTLVSGPVNLPTPYGVMRFDVLTAVQMLGKVEELVADNDIFIAVAAVADWRVKNMSMQKIKKENNDQPALAFEENPDILATIAKRDNPPYCVGFAAESENLLTYGEEKRKRKKVPLLVGNIGHKTFGLDENELVLFDETGHITLARADKQVLARQLVQEIAKRVK